MASYTEDQIKDPDNDSCIIGQCSRFSIHILNPANCSQQSSTAQNPPDASQLGKSPNLLSNQELTASQKNDWPNTGQNRNNISPEDPELAKLIEIWPQLSGKIKKAIIKMTDKLNI